jgi:hypothetical protein
VGSDQTFITGMSLGLVALFCFKARFTIFLANYTAARSRHIAGTRWSTKQDLNMELLRQRNATIA